MKISETVKDVNRRLGPTVFKPGYPTARREYLVLDSRRKDALRLLAERGVEAKRSPCGHDYNYGGGLYRLSEAKR